MSQFLLRRLTILWLGCFMLFGGCTYNGQIRRGIYKHKDYKEKINARVMVVADKFYPQRLTLDGTSQYVFYLSDGFPVAAADALATLFTEVDVNEYKYRKNYDYIAELDYHADLTAGRAEVRLKNTLSSQVFFRPFLRTTLTLTLRNPRTGYAVARYHESLYSAMPNAEANVWLWLTSFLRMASLGLLTPLDVQAYGNSVRRLMEKSMVAVLKREIMPKIADDRLNFSKTEDLQPSNTRVDGKFLPFLQATVYIYTDDSLGSGFLVSSDGYIVTNYHVVQDSRDVSVILYDQRALMDKTSPIAFPEKEKIHGKVRLAKVLAFNKTRDLALLKMEGEDLPYLELETDRSSYVTGLEVAAIGAPWGVDWSVSRGIISAVRDNNGVDTIQTDTPINKGNSGGPLISLQSGKVLGVNSWARTPATQDELQAGVNGLNFAISSYEVMRTLGFRQPVHADDFPHPAD